MKHFYTVQVSTTQILNGEVIVESDHPLTKDEIGEKAVELANASDMEWEAKDIDPGIDINEIEES